ncbi:MAG: hypothetical protein J0H18_14535 [Rhizobiales bacterium]|nr:hypothetical protein [Hyphomicrobiales bacterium]
MQPEYEQKQRASMHLAVEWKQLASRECGQTIRQGADLIPSERKAFIYLGNDRPPGDPVWPRGIPFSGNNKKAPPKRGFSV